MFKVASHGAVQVVSYNEPLTGDSVEEFKDLVEGMIAKGHRYSVLEMSAIKLLDSDALEALLDTRDRFEDIGGTFKLAAPLPLCNDILSLTGVEQELEVYGELPQAVGSFLR